jgi:membrane-associated phospholipid phosphatase
MDLYQFFFGTAPIADLQELIGLGYPFPFRVFSLLGDTWGMLFVIGIGFWLWGRRVLYPLVGIVVVGAATKVLLSSIFAASRPSGPDLTVYQELEASSFPSGHVYEAVGPWGLLYALGRIRLWVAVLVVALVGLGRLYLGVHFVGDVVAGMAFGALLVWAYWKLWPHVEPWLAARSFGAYVMLACVVAVGAVVYLVLPAPGPRRLEVIGLALGAAAALPAEHRWLGYAPTAGGWGVRTIKVLIGTAGLAACVVWDRLMGDDALWIGVVAAILAVLWVLLAAPALFARLGWGRAEARVGTDQSA